MEKQRNRGQDGAGIATMRLHSKSNYPNYPLFSRIRSNALDPISDIHRRVSSELEAIRTTSLGILNNPKILEEEFRFIGELMLGHLRYGTQGQNDLKFCHPFISYDSVLVKNIALAGNFNIVNVKELFQKMNIHPKKFHSESDLAAMLEVLKYSIGKEYKGENEEINLVKILKQAVSLFDGGYHLGGLIGNGDGFIVRDPYGIRPSYYYIDDEMVVGVSERPALQTAFGVPLNKIKELEPGHALIIKKDGKILNKEIIRPKKRRACSFERIYFSRGNDSSIYKERLSLGFTLAPRVLNEINNDLENTVFSYIPNTAEVAFNGLIKGIQYYSKNYRLRNLLLPNGEINKKAILKVINTRIRKEIIITKDVKMRTFIAEDSSRSEMIKHVYDITYGVLYPQKDTLVIIDDSIVRGTTLRYSILTLLDRLNPKRIIVLSSAPQIRYPDCYGIDISKIGEFIAFRAVIELLLKRGKEHLINRAYKRCKNLEKTNSMETQNVIHLLYKPFTNEEIAEQIARLITPPDVNTKVDVIFQSIDNLHRSCPYNLGDWYFTGNYPTPGGNRVANKAFLNYMENKNDRGY